MLSARTAWPPRRALASAVLVAAAGACAHGVDALGRIVEPPLLGVRVHPVIVVASTDDPHAVSVATRLVLHLDAGPSDVRLVAQHELEPLRRAGALPAASGVVLVGVEVERGAEPRWTTRPETVCGPVNCYTTRRSYLESVPVVQATLAVTLYDGPSARPLDTLRFAARREGRGWESLEDRVVEQLAAELLRAVDARAVEVRVRLPAIDAPGGEEALAALATGRWSEGRAALERLVASPALAAASVEARANAWLALGQARRFDADDPVDVEARFASAREALETAERLRPRREHRDALADLARHRALLLDLAQQRAAARRNFDYARSADAIPPPPASYLDAPPPPAP